MNRSLGIVALVAALVVAMLGFSAQAFADGGATASAEKSKCAKKQGKAKKNCQKKQKKAKKKVFLVCKHGCKYRTVQKAVDAAGKFKKAKKNKKVKVFVNIKPGRYVEGVVLEGKKFDGLTIQGTSKNARKVVFDGENAKGELGAAQNAIEGIGVSGLVLKNMWAKNYEANAFFLHGSTPDRVSDCDGYVMDNLIASDNRSYGLFARNCFGGKMINSKGWNHGDSAFYIGETPCDSVTWSNRGDNPPDCQAEPKWTVLKNIQSFQNVLGYSGTNSKYVKIVDSDFYNNGAGIVPNTLDSEKFEPNGWMIVENNNIFWNNYNYFAPGSAFQTVSNGLGELLGQTINYPTGVGVVLYGSDGVIVRDNEIFGHYKWGTASFSGPVVKEADVVANEGDDAKNLNNQFIGNEMGRGGTDPNGHYDFWDDNTGGGNCWSGNTPGATFAPGNGTVPLSEIYPACPQPEAFNNASTVSYDFGAGLQANLNDLTDPTTLLGYVSSSPAQNQECSWLKRPHPPFEDFQPAEVPGVQC